jgi:CRP-like cAMP-binding protein
MKGILNLLKRSTANRSADDHPDSVMFTTAFAEMGVEGATMTPWEARANETGAKRMSGSRGVKLLQSLWAKDKYMCRLDDSAISRLERFFDFAIVQQGRELIGQDEYGNFMVVLLTGAIAVDRIQPWGENMRLTEARPGDILGEMSLLDSGLRFSKCTTLTECQVAILGATELDEMMTADPILAANLIALLARKLSLRLRVVSARLTDTRG